ncbi:MAG: hypothetical protein WB508_00960 [Aeromicrobium sp.]|uniref:hypothetical protein n=1 Tax=Aeromicrobium sp. TaxID=1871063 RepID=UPI003C58C0DA
MSLLAVLLAAVGTADLTRLVPTQVSRRTDLVRAVGVGALVALVLARALGFGWHSIWIAVLSGAVVTAVSLPHTRWTPWVLPASIVLVLATGHQVPRARPPIATWYESLEITGLAEVSIPDAALAVAVALFLMQSANVVVRRVLTDAGPDVIAEEQQLKGGRILGPIERLAIFALALSGNVAAISAIVAAKGILRFPEINRDHASGLKAEYVLVGSFVSWGLALVFVPLF